MELDDVLQAWRTNNAVTLKLLGLCPDSALDLKPGRGKTVRGNFTHIVNVRRMWALEKVRSQAEQIEKLDHKTATREQISAGLDQSSDVMEGYFEKLASAKKPGRWSMALFLAYSVAHEADHRAQALLALRMNGHEPDDLAQMGLWDWPKISASQSLG